MALSSAVEGARHTAQLITWTDGDGDPQNLTGATLTGWIRDGSATRAITGTLAVSDGTAGEFTWAYSAADVADAGIFRVQFVATYGDGLADKTLSVLWVVEESLQG